MPGACLEGMVEVRHEVVLYKVEFDLTEELGQHDGPQLDGSDAAG